MGSLDIKSDQKISEQELEVANNESEPMGDSPTTSDENDLLELISEHTSASDSDFNEIIVHSPTSNEEKASCSSSTSSSDFMLEGPFQDAETMNKGTDYTFESPPIQMMERLSPTSQKYRIPSSVFARKESNIDGWGMASNESLFSIQMGGMSFRNQDSINWRSGELDLGFGIEPSPSDRPGMIPEVDETCESDASEKNLDKLEEGRHHKLGEEDKIQSLSEISNNQGLPIADEPMDLNLQGGKSVVEELNSHFSAENVGSRSSFAFPILTADTNDGSSATKTEESEAPPPHPEPDKQKADPTWTNCFGCCTFCSS